MQTEKKTVVVVYINIITTTFYFNFDFYQVFKLQKYKHLNKEKLSIVNFIVLI